MTLIVRRELPSDQQVLRTLLGIVYSDKFYDQIHDDPEWLPELSFVTVNDEGDVVDHVAAMRARVDATSVLALVAPAVRPDRRGQGVGQALMHTVLGAAEARDDPLIGLVATPPESITSLGFRPGDDYSNTPAVGGWKPYFLVRPLTGYTDTFGGTFHFPEAFG